MIAAIVKELVLRAHECKDDVIETIYFGGGTPSVLTISEIEHILEAVTTNYNVIATPEITLEANPDDLSEAQIKALAKTQINRLSIGIQSFFDEELQMMNRAHSAKEAKESLQLATSYFDNVTIDLIYGIPNMNVHRWKANLQLAFASGVQHISSYALTVEPKTALEKFIKQGTYPDVNDEEALLHYKVLMEEVQKHDFIPYEISNFGKKGYFSKHNTSYWKGKKYLGIGPSAHSFYNTTRSWNIANNALYIKALQENNLPNTTEELSVDDYQNNIILVTKKGKFMSDGIAADFFKI